MEGQQQLTLAEQWTTSWAFHPITHLSIRLAVAVPPSCRPSICQSLRLLSNFIWSSNVYPFHPSFRPSVYHFDPSTCSSLRPSIQLSVLQLPKLSVRSFHICIFRLSICNPILLFFRLAVYSSVRPFVCPFVGHLLSLSVPPPNRLSARPSLSHKPQNLEASNSICIFRLRALFDRIFRCSIIENFNWVWIHGNQ